MTKKEKEMIKLKIWLIKEKKRDAIKQVKKDAKEAIREAKLTDAQKRKREQAFGTIFCTAIRVID